ncbi:hypothetical protein IQ03_04326 [Gemmobacter caeni]|uniref:Uncharacterized protein n=1 Tax=Gemmobacter caeni TaxID=589035 RepID=A0A2T6APS9_9RHOB|nr:MULTISPECIES: hypothetical protein [Paracoccaceae]PTX45831.1 hypothetical protein C8N34_12072 [Gemmobacter caeni]TWI94136.1 hypothetical protein IQ03_04326 [Gemmobacter caeni]
MNAPVRTMKTAQNVIIPDDGDPDVLPEIIYQLIRALMRSIQRTNNLDCSFGAGRGSVWLSMGSFEFSHTYGDDLTTDEMLCELAFNALCEAMSVNGIRWEYF